MNTWWTIVFGLVAWTGTATLRGETCAPVRLEQPAGVLTVEECGLSLAPSAADCPSSGATGDAWWAVVMEPAPGCAGGDIILESHRQAAPAVTRSRGGVTLVYRTLGVGQSRYDVAVTLTFRAEDGVFEIGGELRNRTKEWLVKGFTGPVVNGIRTTLAETPLLMPSGFGWRINGVPDDPKSPKPWARNGERLVVEARYPSANCTMQWFAFAGEKGGLYFGSHDLRHGAKTLSARYDPASRRFGAAFQHEFFVRPGERREIPPTVVMPYMGSWHAAARAYRAWADTAGSPLKRPEWTRTASGWLLAILKQQNGDIMWPYGKLAALSEVADRHGLDILGLFGWGYGGHDHLYPDYNPCPLMGGETALREGIKAARARGKRVVLYANGQLLERGTAYWTETGRHLAVTCRDGGTVQEFWHKYGNTPGYHFDIGCHATRGWRERMLALALQANDFGADGILYDQLGMRGPTPCYAANHGHPVPFMAYEEDRKEMLRQIADKMREINPDFAVMTEGFHDAILDSISFFHGCVRGCFQESSELIARRTAGTQMEELFPEMLRYTYPEVVSTIRFPSPLVDRTMANYALAFGLRYEIESRYIPDRDYLLDGRIPTVEDYGTVLSKPNLELMRTLPREETARYLKAAANFQKRHAELLMTGRFTDTEGFSFAGTGVVAKGFESGRKFGVLLWNTTGQPAAFRLEMSGVGSLTASEPDADCAEPFAALAPQTVRLVQGIR